MLSFFLFTEFDCSFLIDYFQLRKMSKGCKLLQFVLLYNQSQRAALPTYNHPRFTGIVLFLYKQKPNEIMFQSQKKSSHSNFRYRINLITLFSILFFHQTWRTALRVWSRWFSGWWRPLTCSTLSRSGKGESDQCQNPLTNWTKTPSTHISLHYQNKRNEQFNRCVSKQNCKDKFLESFRFRFRFFSFFFFMFELES